MSRGDCPGFLVLPIAAGRVVLRTKFLLDPHAVAFVAIVGRVGQPVATIAIPAIGAIMIRYAAAYLLRFADIDDLPRIRAIAAKDRIDAGLVAKRCGFAEMTFEVVLTNLYCHNVLPFISGDAACETGGKGASNTLAATLTRSSPGIPCVAHQDSIRETLSFPGDFLHQVLLGCRQIRCFNDELLPAPAGDRNLQRFQRHLADHPH